MAINYGEMIYAQGDDALTNQYQVVFPPFPGSTDTNSTIIRIKSFTIPDYKLGTYEVKYKTDKIKKISGQIGSEKDLKFNFRVDKYYKTYTALESWINMLQNHETGQMAEDGNLTTPSTLRIPVDIIPIDMNGNITKAGWTFTNCLITDLGDPKFSEEN